MRQEIRVYHNRTQKIHTGGDRKIPIRRKIIPEAQTPGVEMQQIKTLIYHHQHNHKTKRRTTIERYPIPSQIHGNKKRLQPLPSHKGAQANTKNTRHH